MGAKTEGLVLFMRDGAAPIAGAQVHVEYGGKTFPIYSNEQGQLPALPHPKEGEPSTKVKVYKPDGTWKTLLELLPNSPPRTGILVLDMLVMVGQTLGHTAPQGAKDEKIPVHYRVKPGDNLSKIASQFRSTPAEIKKLNNLSSDLIHPEQMLWIHAVGAEVKPSKAKAAAKQSAQASIKAKAANAAKAKTEQKNQDKKEQSPSYLEQLATWVSPTPVQYARSKEGEGAPLALFDPGDKRAPWMQVVVAEAKKFKGREEAEIEKTTNYATEIKGGLKTIVGNKNPWCAAFANWCLDKAGYPTDKGTAWAARANAFVQHTVNNVDSHQPFNSLFSIIDKPIYGAIAVVGKPRRGHHVGFVYGINGKSVIVLGGNQGDAIKCIPYGIAECWFLVPSVYLAQARKDMEANDLPAITSEFANKELGLTVSKKQGVL